MSGVVIRKGKVPFSIESRLLRELGERLVRQPEVAIVELVKNAYDANATRCTIAFDNKGGDETITVSDDGDGITLARFTGAWMRIGTSSKEVAATTKGYGRPVTGEKGIGRFAVRYLGRTLHLRSVATDGQSGSGLTELTARFDWTEFDKNEDLGKLRIPYVLREADPGEETGTTLTIGDLRAEARRLDLRRVRSDSVGLLSPLRTLLAEMPGIDAASKDGQDPGFELKIDGEDDVRYDVARDVLGHYVLRAEVELSGTRLTLRVYRRGSAEPDLSISDTTENRIGELRADIRFFPRRKGVFAGASVDGRTAYTWVKDHSGVAVFDRGFRVAPYGYANDDWLFLAADTARNRRDPRSSIAAKHLTMTAPERSDTSLNWMLRLPQSAQLVGLVQVEGQRGSGSDDSRTGLVAAADREGFVQNDAFAQLVDVARGAVEAIAFVDRIVQQENDERDEQDRRRASREETEAAIREIEENKNLSAHDRRRIVTVLTNAQDAADSQAAQAQERERQLETVSLLGVVSGFMTHEFGSAQRILSQAEATIRGLSDDVPELIEHADELAERIGRLNDFTKYARGFIRSARSTPGGAFKAKPLVRQVVNVFGDFAAERKIALEVDIDSSVEAPPVPVALYSGLVLNLYTNALKAVIASTSTQDHRIAFRGWNDATSHTLEVSDTGIGIPASLRERVFDPLFSTTSGQQSGPLGSGMGLGLALVRRAAKAYGGLAAVVDAPPGFSTCVRITFPRRTADDD